MSLGVQGDYRGVDGAIERVGVGEGLAGEMMRLEIVPDNLDVVEFGRAFGKPRPPMTSERRSPCHLPPGTSKWNRIEHRLFSFITGNRHGKPLVSHAVIVQSIGAATTKTGLKVRCELDPDAYPAGIKVTDDELAAVDIARHAFHGERNCTAREPWRPRSRTAWPSASYAAHQQSSGSASLSRTH